MRVYISVDIEGIAGVSLPLQGKKGNSDYETARKLMTAEASAAVRGAFSAGAESVTVSDSHSSMQNILAGELDPRAQLISGSPRHLSMVSGLNESFDAAVFVGFHSASGSFGTMSHTYNGTAFSAVRAGGKLVGETFLFGKCANELGVPLYAVAGDDALELEVADEFPETSMIKTKCSLGAWSVWSLSPQMSCKKIETEVKKQLSLPRTYSSKSFHGEVIMFEVEAAKQSFADAFSLLPSVTRLDARRVKFCTSSYLEAVNVIQVLSYIAMGVVSNTT